MAEPPTANTRPTRDAERNRDAPVAAERRANADGFLPTLDPGITLLDVRGGRAVPVLQSLVLDHLLLEDGPAFWVDANGHATTASLARLAPSRRLLDRIHVARGVTAYQAYGALRDLPAAVADHRAAAETTPDPALLVAPALDARYRDADALADADADAATLVARGLARLAACAREYDAPALVTRTDDDALTDPIEAAADHHLRCERTRMGPRFVGDDFETLVYPADGDTFQTTVAYWRRLLGARAERTGCAPAPRPGTGRDGVGTAVTAAGTTTTPASDPLLDAWAGAGGR